VAALFDAPPQPAAARTVATPMAAKALWFMGNSSLAVHGFTRRPRPIGSSRVGLREIPGVAIAW